MRRKLLFIVFVVSAIAVASTKASAQGCNQISFNQLCAEEAPTEDSLQSNPFSFGCFNHTLTYFYQFHTGTDPSGQVYIDVNPTDCDDFLGPNLVTVNIIEVPIGINPCNPVGSPFVGTCQSNNGPFTAAYSGLNPDQDYMVVVGSNHDPVYGPCAIEINVSGPAVDISSTVTPLIISLGESSDITVEGAPSSSSFTWSPETWLENANTATPTSTPESTISYSVSTQIGPCTVTDQITVNVGPPIIIFNAITPNGDLNNDTWTIRGIERFENCEVNIYDRWGQNVFRSIGYATPWDGTNKGKFLPTGAYYYVIELNSFDVTIPPFIGEISIVH
jgi:gliding motility-associated-like protein